MKTVVYLMRHTQTIPQDGVENRSWTLSDTGKSQAALAAPVLASLDIDVIYASPYVRAVECIQPFAELKGLDIYTHEGFKDINITSKTVPPAEFQEIVKNMFEDHRFSDPSGESFEVCQKRIVRALNDIAKIHAGKRILVCTHGLPIAAVLKAADSTYGYDDLMRMKMPDIFKFVSNGNDGRHDKGFRLDF